MVIVKLMGLVAHILLLAIPPAAVIAAIVALIYLYTLPLSSFASADFSHLIVGGRAWSRQCRINRNMLSTMIFLILVLMASIMNACGMIPDSILNLYRCITDTFSTQLKMGWDYL